MIYLKSLRKGGETVENDEWRREISLNEAIIYMDTLLDSLETFHERGRLHLKICPESIEVRDGKMCLKEPEETVQKPSTVLGKYKEYAAPEQRLKIDRRIGAASDLYSVCAVFYQLLSGQAPKDEHTYGGAGRFQVQSNWKIFQGEPKEKVWIVMGIVRRGMHPLSAKRYQTVGELKRVLEIVKLANDPFGK